MKKLLLATILTTSIATASTADEYNDHGHDHGNAKGHIGFEKAKEIALKAVLGSAKVVESELEIEEDGDEAYEIEVEVGGVTTEVEIDAKTGEVLEMEADD